MLITQSILTYLSSFLPFAVVDGGASREQLHSLDEEEEDEPDGQWGKVCDGVIGNVSHDSKRGK